MIIFSFLLPVWRIHNVLMRIRIPLFKLMRIRNWIQRVCFSYSDPNKNITDSKNWFVNISTRWLSWTSTTHNVWINISYIIWLSRSFKIRPIGGLLPLWYLSPAVVIVSKQESINQSINKLKKIFPSFLRFPDPLPHNCSQHMYCRKYISLALY